MSEPIITKRCSHCNQIKPLSEFYKDRTRKDEHQRYCKICQNKLNKAYFQTETGRINYRKAIHRYDHTEKGKAKRKRFQKTEKYKVSVKRYLQSEKGRNTHKIKQKRFRIQHPEFSKATNIVNNAIASGKLPRPDTKLCYYCLKPAQEYHHWHGYAPDHWLDIIAVCRKCHNFYCHHKRVM